MPSVQTSSLSTVRSDVVSGLWRAQSMAAIVAGKVRGRPLDARDWLCRRDQGAGLIHHSDRGVRYLSINDTERLAEAGIEPSVGGVGSSYDKALAETINGLHKTEVIRRWGPWRSFEAVEFATLGGVD